MILFNFEGLRDLEIWGCSSAGRAPALQAGGREFETHHLHQSANPLGKGSERECGPVAQMVRARA